MNMWNSKIQRGKNKMTKFKIIAISFCFVLLMSSCGNGLVSKNNLKLSKGTDFSIFQSENIKYDGKLVLAKLNAKTKDEYVVFVTRMRGALEGELYYYAFKNDKLLYWGQPYMFARHENEILRDIADETLDYAKSLYK